MIDSFVAQLRANSCAVAGPVTPAEACALVVERADGLVACNDDVDLPGLRDQLRARAELMTPNDDHWQARLPTVDVGITGARIAIAEPAAVALAAAPGSPRATSLLPPAHVCLLRVGDLVPSLTEALDRLAAEPMPSALTWIGGPSRTGDLEMIITLGVHGPRTVDVILVEDQ